MYRCPQREIVIYLDYFWRLTRNGLVVLYELCRLRIIHPQIPGGYRKPAHGAGLACYGSGYRISYHLYMAPSPPFHYLLSHGYIIRGGQVEEEYIWIEVLYLRQVGAEVHDVRSQMLLIYGLDTGTFISALPFISHHLYIGRFPSQYGNGLRFRLQFFG